MIFKCTYVYSFVYLCVLKITSMKVSIKTHFDIMYHIYMHISID